MNLHMKTAVLLWIGLFPVGMMAQKIILDGEGAALEAQMELYSRRTNSAAMKQQYASYATREDYTDFSAVQFKEIYEKQLKAMFLMVGGKLIQVKEWRYREPLSYSVAPRARLEPIENLPVPIPEKYRVQVKTPLGNGCYLAKVSKGRQGNLYKGLVVFEGANAANYRPDAVLEAYLIKINPLEVTGITLPEPVAIAWKCVPDEMGDSVHPPTLQEMAAAMKSGRVAPIVLVPEGDLPCEMCAATGIDQAKIDAAAAAAKAESRRLGKSRRTYDLFGKATVKRNDLGESKAFTAAKLKRNKPKCQTCGGDGKVPCEVFRRLIQK